MKLVDFLFEVGNTALPITWVNHVDGETGDFTYKDLSYRIMIETNYAPELNTILPNKKIGFVSFLFQNPETNQYTQDITNLAGQHASTIFAIVKNALKDKFDDYDIMFFTSKRDISPLNYATRESLYSHLFFRLLAEKGYPHYSFGAKNGYVWVVSKEQIDEQIKLIQDNYTF